MKPSEAYETTRRLLFYKRTKEMQPFSSTQAIMKEMSSTLVRDGSTFLAPRKRPSLSPQERSVSDRKVHGDFIRRLASGEFLI